MANKYAVASGLWSSTSTWSDTDGGPPGASPPADGDAVFISAGVSVQMNVDQSSFTGLFTVTIRGGTTPGMLYWMNGASGYLKIRSGYNLVGTTATNRGRLLANSDGSWATTTPLQFSNKAVIDLQGTSRIDATNLDIRLRATHPTTWMVHTYGSKFEFNAATDVSVANDTINLGVTPPAAGTAVTLVPLSGASLPAPFVENCIYYVRAVSGTTCKLAYQNSDALIVDITAVGSGTVALLTGYAAGSTTVNVLQDVTSDTPWTTASGHNRAVLVDSAPEAYDQQRVTISTINPTSIVLSAAVGASKFPGARLVLASRNVSIRSAGTSTIQPIVDFGSSTFTGCIFDCEIANTTGSGTTFYGYGVHRGVGHTFSGTIWGCERGVSAGSGHTISGSVFGCYYGIFGGVGYVVSGLVAGCMTGIYTSSCLTLSGSVFGCTAGLELSSIVIISGFVFGCHYGSLMCSGLTVSGSIFSCNVGIDGGTGNVISGAIFGNSYDFGFPVGKVTMLSGAFSTLILGARNASGRFGRISWENFNGVLNAHKAIDAFGDVIRTACDGAGDAPSQDPTGGNGDCIEASNIQSNCSAENKLVIFDSHRIWLAAGSYTITYRVQTTYTGISAGGLRLTARYISGSSPLTMAEQSSAPAISQRSNKADWSQTISVSITTAVAGWVDLRMELMQYQANNEVYVWPIPTIS